MGNLSESFNIVDLLYESVRKHPGKTAIIYKDKQISFGEFDKQVSETASYFLNKGIVKGDRVMVFVPMSIDLYRTVLAIFRIGATAVFLDEWVGKKRMEECCKVAQCKAIIGNYKVTILSLISSELRKIPVKHGVSWSFSGTMQAMPVTTNEDTALITFTTGSTGTPKAAKRTHGFLKAQFEALIQKIGVGEDEVDMPVLPIVLLMNLATGATSVIADYKASKPNSLKPARIIEQLEKYHVTRIIASPYFIKQIAKYVIESNSHLPGVKNIFTGGAPVFPAEAEIYYKAFPAVNIEVVYGSTESEPISSINVQTLIKEKENILSHGLNVGKIDKSAEVMIIKIIDDNINISANEDLIRLQQPAGTIGEIIVAGKHVLREYFNNVEALKRNKIFVEGKCWHRTGDSGYFDAYGTLFLTGRCNTLINNNGITIAPFIFENYFQTIDGVEMGTILMVNNKLTAIIELTADGKKEPVKQRINILPIEFGQIIFFKQLPRDPRHNSKIDYQKLISILK